MICRSALSVLSLLVLADFAGAQVKVPYTFQVDPSESNFTWEITTPVGILTGIPDNTFALSGTFETLFTEGTTSAYSWVRITSGDLHVPPIAGEVPGILEMDLYAGATMSIESIPLAYGNTGQIPLAGGLVGRITMIGGDLLVDFLGQGPTNIPVAGGTSPHFILYGSLDVDPADGSMQMRAPVSVTFELDVSGIPLLFEIDGEVVGNWEADPPATFCIGAPNSAGPGATMDISGSQSVFLNNLTLRASGLPPSTFGMFVYGSNNVSPFTFGDGFVCIGAGLQRLGLVVCDPAGTGQQTLDLTLPPDPSAQVHPGETWHYQFWYRDTPAMQSGINFSEGLSIEWKL